MRPDFLAWDLCICKLLPRDGVEHLLRYNSSVVDFVYEIFRLE